MKMSKRENECNTLKLHGRGREEEREEGGHTKGYTVPNKPSTLMV
jgi:hypothetical protein